MWTTKATPRGTDRGRTGRKRVLSLFAASALVALAACGGSDDSGDGDGDGGETFELIIGHHEATGGPRALQIEDYIEAVNEASEHTIEAKFYHDAALCPPNEQAICARDGRIDITQVLPTYHPAEFPMSTVTALGFMNIPDAMGLAFMDLYNSNEDVQAEWEAQKLRPLFPTTVGDYTIGVNTPLESIDDMAGLSIRAIGASAASLQSVGVETAALAAPEIYESVQRGVIDGWSIPIDYALTQGYFEVTSHVYDIGLGPALSSIFSMNADTWASLPEDLQQTFLEVGNEFALNAWDDYMLPSIREGCAEAGSDLEFVGVLEEGRDEFMANGLEITTKDWIDNIAGDSVDDPQGLADTYRSMLDERAEELSDGFLSTAEACAEAR